MSFPVDGLGAFSDALLDPGQPPPAGLTAWNGSDPALRFAVYRNNVAVSLVGALADTFPVTRQLVGGPVFDAMARCFIVSEPPRSAVLTDYGDGFPAFISGFAPVAHLPYLPDLAALERKRVLAYHAADFHPLDGNALAVHLLDPERLPGARIALDPSTGIVRSRYAVVSLWVAYQGECLIETVQLDRPESAFILRQGDEVLALPINAGTAIFIAALAEGTPFAEAATAAGVQDPAFDLVEALTLLIRRGGIAAWH